MNNIKTIKNVPVPQALFSAMVDAYYKWEKFSDQLEDFLMDTDDRRQCP